MFCHYFHNQQELRGQHFYSSAPRTIKSGCKISKYKIHEQKLQSIVSGVDGITVKILTSKFPMVTEIMTKHCRSHSFIVTPRSAVAASDLTHISVLTYWKIMSKLLARF